MRMRHLLHFATALCALAAQTVAAHCTTYTFTPTLVDLTTASNVTGAFGSGSGAFSFNDPPTSSYVDSLFIVAKNVSDEDELSLNFAFTAPGTGTDSITGDVDLDGRREGNTIDWDSTSNSVTLSNGSVVKISIPTSSVNLSACGDDDEEGCSCPEDRLCGSTNVTVAVLTNDPPIAPTPEPSSLALLGTGLVGLGGCIRRKLIA